jgi:hypothetical protein
VELAEDFILESLPELMIAWDFCTMVLGNKSSSIELMTQF